MATDSRLAPFSSHAQRHERLFRPRLETMQERREVPRWVLLVVALTLIALGFLLAKFTDGKFGPQGTPPGTSSAPRLVAMRSATA